MKPSKALKKICPPEIRDDVLEVIRYLQDITLEPTLRRELSKLERTYTCECCGELGCMELK